MHKIQYERFSRIDEQHWWFQSRREIVSTLLGRMSGGGQLRIVDVGTGTGGMLPVLSQFGTVTGVEPDKDTMEFTSSKYSFLKGAQFINSDWKNAQLESKHFDLLTAFDVLEHCENDFETMLCWRNLVKDGGRVLITVPAYQSLWGANDELSHHYRRYDKGMLQKIFDLTDLKLEKITYINSAMFLPVWLSRNIKERLERKLGVNRQAPWDFELPPSAVNFTLKTLFSSERFVLPYIDLPFGTSVLAVAHVPAAKSGFRSPAPQTELVSSQQ